MYVFARNTDEAKFGHHGSHTIGFGSKNHMHSKVKDLLKHFYFEEPEGKNVAYLGKAEADVPEERGKYKFNSAFEK
jgi:hypothetical protein